MQVRMPKQAGSSEGRELWPLDTNLLKTPVAGTAAAGVEGCRGHPWANKPG